MKTSASIWLGLVAVLSVRLAATAASTYTPSTDAAVFEWLKADTLNQASGSPVSTWPASVGSSLVNPASATQPVFNTSIQNGLPAVNFSGTTFLSVSTTFSAVAQPYTAVLVFQYLDPAFANEVLLSGIPGGNDVRIENLGNSTFTLYDGGVDGPGGAPSDHNWHMAMFVFNGASSKYRFDTGSDTTFGASPGSKAINSIFLGNNVNLGAKSTFNLGELLLYQGDQSTNETAIFAYLTSRWAITTGASTTTTNSSAAIVTTNVSMLWSPVANAVGYTLYWGTASSNYNQMVSGSSSQTNLTATGLATNGTYYLAVTATAADGTESPYSSEVIYQPTGALLPPTGFHIVSNP